jgi:hypothetical protein
MRSENKDFNYGDNTHFLEFLNQERSKWEVIYKHVIPNSETLAKFKGIHQLTCRWEGGEERFERVERVKRGGLC